MGYMRHHAIVVSSWEPALINRAHKKAVEIFPTPNGPTAITPATINGWSSFLVPPDGSKEGWPESEEGDRRRDELITYLRSLAYEDGSSGIDYAEVQFGDDNLEAVVVRSQDQDYLKASGVVTS